MTIPLILTHALSLANALKYPLVMVGAFLEGPVLMIAAGFLLKHKALTLVPLFFSLIAGDLIGDNMWYCIGRYGAEPLIKKRGKWLGVTTETFEKAKGLFLDHHKKILIFSKLTLGFGVAKGVLMAAGAARVSIKTFLLINLIGEVIFVVALLALGYFFGDVYSNVAHQYKAYFVVGLIIIVITIFALLSRTLKKRFLASKIS
jgi:membrane protein DedA with SNARE-associated domain